MPNTEITRQEAAIAPFASIYGGTELPVGENTTTRDWHLEVAKQTLEFYACGGDHAACDCPPGDEDKDSLSCGYRAARALRIIGGSFKDPLPEAWELLVEASMAMMLNLSKATIAAMKDSAEAEHAVGDPRVATGIDLLLEKNERLVTLSNKIALFIERNSK